MKKLLILGLIGCCTLLGATNSPNLFHEGGYLAVQQEALASGKFQFIEFHAKWCLPCKHMDQTTFRDPALRDYLTTHFVSAKVDIDDFDGFALKQKFEVRFLPTLLVLDSRGNVVAKFEEAMGASALQRKLESVVANRSDVVVEKTVTTQTPGQATSSQKKPDKTIFLTDKTILQFGVFGSEVNAKRLYEEIAEYLPSYPDMKAIELSNGQTAYALQYGPFEEMNEAETVQEELRLLGYDSIIKKMQ